MNINKKDINYPKVLIVSHNALSKTSNMGKTLTNIFADWPKESLAQLYFRNETPNKGICEQYFMITDFDMIKSLYSKNNNGKSFKDKHLINTIYENRNYEKKIYDIGKKRRPFMYILRNTLWASKKWNNYKLKEWIEEVNPDVIFFASGGYSFSCKITMHISKTYNIPIITYISDDFYINSTKTISLVDFINKIEFKKTFKKLMNNTHDNIYICDMMKKEYDKVFNKNGKVIMTTSKLEEKNTKDKNKIKISYIGNLGLGRNYSLIELGKVINKIDNNLFIDVYSIEDREEILRDLNESNGIRFKGSICPEEVELVIEESDILLHVESMNKNYRELVKYSISTKIADSLSSGRCIIAYGPQDVASIKYLKDNESACVITNKDEIEDKVTELINNKDIQTFYINNARKTAKERHNSKINSMILNKLVFDVKNECR